VNARNHVLALEHADAMRRTGQTHLESGVTREQHFVAELDRRDVGANGGDDAGAHMRRLVGGDDQPARELRLVELLDDEMVIQRFERGVAEWLPFQHGLHDTPCVRVGRQDVPVTNPDKVFFPATGLTKLDLVTYYVGVAELCLPHLRRRPFHMKRFPNGVEQDFFHQKRVPANHPDYVDEVLVRFPSGHSTVFAIVDNAPALAWVANLGCIELHTWHSRVPAVERPDYLLIDLDPTSDGQWAFVREIALVVRDVLDELGLHSYPKTSGATGLHILVPIKPELMFPEVRRFAKAVAVEVERRIGAQAIATTTWRVADRVGVFVDYGQNARDRTIASAYSVRPVADARVSAPLAWDEVASVEPGAFTVETMPARIAAVGDPTSGMWRNPPALGPRFPQLGLEPPSDR